MGAVLGKQMRTGGLVAMFGDSIAQAVDALNRGEAVVFPTDTVLGLGLAVDKAPSPALLYDIKQRDEGKPIAWLVGDVADLDRFGRDIPAYARVLATRFWPGALTLVVAAHDNVPTSFASARQTIALRMPDCPRALELIRAAGAPLAVTSANVAGEPAPSCIEDLDVRVADAVAYVLRDVPANAAERMAGSGVASTIVDCTSAEPIILREGSITADSIREVLS